MRGPDLARVWQAGFRVSFGLFARNGLHTKCERFKFFLFLYKTNYINFFVAVVLFWRKQLGVRKAVECVKGVCHECARWVWMCHCRRAARLIISWLASLFRPRVFYFPEGIISPNALWLHFKQLPGKLICLFSSSFLCFDNNDSLSQLVKDCLSSSCLIWLIWTSKMPSADQHEWHVSTQYVTLNHKTSLTLLGYVCSNSQKSLGH